MHFPPVARAGRLRQIRSDRKTKKKLKRACEMTPQAKQHILPVAALPVGQMCEGMKAAIVYQICNNGIN
jgi:hypothetical protein